MPSTGLADTHTMENFTCFIFIAVMGFISTQSTTIDARLQAYANCTTKQLYTLALGTQLALVNINCPVAVCITDGTARHRQFYLLPVLMP
jgi:ABC-type spermidine/putrescine transport system permease subunit I